MNAVNEVHTKEINDLITNANWMGISSEDDINTDNKSCMVEVTETVKGLMPLTEKNNVTWKTPRDRKQSMDGKKKYKL